MTKKEKFAKILKVIETTTFENEADKIELIDSLKHEIELIEKRSLKSSASDIKAKKEQAEIKELIINTLIEIGQPSTVSEILAYPTVASFRTLKGEVLSNQRLSALITKLKEEGRVNRIVEKKKAYFSVIEHA